VLKMRSGVGLVVSGAVAMTDLLLKG